MRQLGTKAGDYLVHADLALGQRLERDEHASLVLGSVAADESQNVLDRRVLLHDANELIGFVPHVQERNILVAHDGASHATRILLREEAFRNDDIKPHIYYDHEDSNGQGES